MKLLVAGDFCPQERVAELFNRKEYGAVLNDVRDVVKGHDYAILNFECPIVKGPGTPIEKCGPNLKCSLQGLEAVKWAGFNAVTLANNHFYDYGEEGVSNTLEACSGLNLDVVGGGMDCNEAEKVLYKEIQGVKIGIINCCEHEFSIASDNKAGSNPLNSIKQYYSIQESKKNADYTIVIVHGGNEMFQYPSPRMVETYRFFIDVGADVVINHHQHCYSGYEEYREKFIFYGLGNFCFDEIGMWDEKLWCEGYVVSLNFDNNKITFDIIPYKQSNREPKVCLMNLKEQTAFQKNISIINSVICNNKELEKKYALFLEQSRKEIEQIFQPYSSRLSLFLYNHRWLPTVSYGKMKRLLLLDYFQCESHIVKVLNFFR